jgi:hypothetical protein
LWSCTVLCTNNNPPSPPAAGGPLSNLCQTPSSRQFHLATNILIVRLLYRYNYPLLFKNTPPVSLTIVAAITSQQKLKIRIGGNEKTLSAKPKKTKLVTVAESSSSPSPLVEEIVLPITLKALDEDIEINLPTLVKVLSKPTANNKCKAPHNQEAQPNTDVTTQTTPAFDEATPLHEKVPRFQKLNLDTTRKANLDHWRSRHFAMPQSKEANGTSSKLTD